MRYRAFNRLGLSAILSKQHQFAYDVFISWINCYLLESVKKHCHLNNNYSKAVNESLKDEEEKRFREENPRKVAIMYDNFAYTCLQIYDYLGADEDAKVFLRIAEYYIDRALLYYPACSILSDAGIIKAQSHKYVDSVKCFERCCERIDIFPFNVGRLRMKTAALRMMISYYPMVSDEKNDQWLERKSKDYIESYKRLLDLNRNNDDEVLKGRNLYYLLLSCRKIKRRRFSIENNLLSIEIDTKAILKCLRRTIPIKEIDYHQEVLGEIIGNHSNNSHGGRTIHKNAKDQREDKKIAYYTTLNNLKYLFDSEEDSETDKACKSDENKINQLTMMHARYMNDPDEGLILFDHLKDNLCVSPEELRDKLYDQKYVFLKSFTGLVDQLNMWTLYASDRENGEDCNGCCVWLEPESFNVIPKSSSSRDKDSDASNQASHMDDDYDLYNVAYFDGEKLFVNGEENSELEQKYNHLKTQLSKLKASVENDKACQSIISDCLVRLLEKPMFLFKDISYSLEEESRIIISRDFSDRDEIKKTSAENMSKKIFINPPLQVFPYKIILGPKVENADFLIPYLQYKLSEIKDKWNYDKDYEPIVRKSEINIR